jgi:hypothetical protein
MYKTMGVYGLLNNQWALILAMTTIASPYAIWVLKQASDKLPVRTRRGRDHGRRVAAQLFRLIYLPLMVPSLVAVGTYAILLAWNEYLYAFLLLSKDTSLTLPVALGNFLAADDSPWELLMTAGLIYALPPAAIYYAFRRYMVSGLTAGAVKWTATGPAGPSPAPSRMRQTSSVWNVALIMIGNCTSDQMIAMPNSMWRVWTRLARKPPTTPATANRKKNEEPSNPNWSGVSFSSSMIGLAARPTTTLSAKLISMKRKTRAVMPQAPLRGRS